MSINLANIYSQEWTSLFHLCAALVDDKIKRECYRPCNCLGNGIACTTIYDHGYKWDIEKLDTLNKELWGLGACITLTPLSPGEDHSHSQAYFHYPNGATLEGFKRMWELYITWCSDGVKSGREQTYFKSYPKFTQALFAREAPVVPLYNKLYYATKINDEDLISINGSFYKIALVE